MRRLDVALAWLGVCMCAAWPRLSFAVEAPTLPLTECRLEHPLKLISVAARCGSLRVPEDREHPADRSIELKVAVVPALNRRSTAAPMFLLAGGPGQSAVQVYVALNGAFARINRNHAVVLLDQRGTGSSSPQICEYPEEWQQPADPMPALRKATAECLAKLGPRVRFYTTSIAVQDLEDIRAALGFPQIDLYGASYGTRVAEHYMRRHPARVHAVILDGVTYPEQVIGVETPQDGEQALNLIVARCRQAPDCAAVYPDLQQDLESLLRQFGPQKVMVTIDDPNSGLPLEIEFNHKILGSALRFLSYSAMQASLLPALIHQAAHGKLRPMASQAIMNARQIGDQLANGMQYSVICSEDEPFFAAANIDRAAMAKTYQGTELVDALHEICKLWPRGPVDADLHAPLHSDIPTLLLSGEADPVTPPADAERASVGLAHHRHLILKGEGHGQLNTGCVPKLMADFLDSAAPENLDATCLEQHSPEPFFLSMTGPAP
ncbi:MAG TPA: alpha/beta hydrolase [Steroidobacteraceae bacterium]|jgi:pimeloyl-ACP methyl ester carboxylesterase|nr:alpha/beta hydrolase [Steroidobacteraceae bacterium]